MIKLKLYLTGIVCLLVTIESFSQAETISLPKAWEIAFEYYPGLTEKEALIKETQYGRKEVTNNFLPHFRAQVQNTYGTFSGSTGAFFPLPGTFNVSGNNLTRDTQTGTMNTFGSVLFDWKVFEFGRQRKAVKIAESTIDEAITSFKATKISLQREVADRFTDVVYNRSKRQWANDNASRVKEILVLTKSLADAGLKPGADTLLAASSYLQTLGELDDWTGRFQASKIRITEVVPIDTALVSYQSTHFLNPGVVATYSDSVSRAHPYLDIIENEIRTTRFRGELASRKLLPTFSLLGGISSRGSGINADGTVNSEWSSGFKNQSNNYLVGVALTWNINDAFNSITERKRIQQQQLASELKYEAQSLQFNTQLNAATTTLKEQMKKIQKTREAVTNASNAFDLYLARYENGLLNLTELLQIQLLLQEAERTNIDAHYQYWKQVIIHSELSGDFTYLSNQFN